MPDLPSNTLTAEHLAAITGYQRRCDIERCLRMNGRRFFVGRSGPWTTLDLVNAAGGIQTARPTGDELL